MNNEHDKAGVPSVKTPQAQGPSLSTHYLSSRLRFDTFDET